MAVVTKARMLALACMIPLAASCSGDAGEENSANAVEPAANSAAPVVAVAEPPLSRGDLLLAVVRAASAAAAGQRDSEAQRQLDGKRFEVAIRFGCAPAAAEQGSLGWSFDEGERTLRLSAAPNVSADDALVAPLLEAGKFEAVEGFWIPRPWLLTDACPPAPPPASEPPDAEVKAKPAASKDTAKSKLLKDAAAPAPAQRVAIAQFFTPTDPRTGRRSGRPYESVVTLDEKQPPPAQGLNLVLSGRLTPLPSGRVISCAVTGPDRPPDCLVSADVDHVRIERPGARTPLAQWSR